MHQFFSVTTQVLHPSTPQCPAGAFLPEKTNQLWTWALKSQKDEVLCLIETQDRNSIGNLPV